MQSLWVEGVLTTNDMIFYVDVFDSQWGPAVLRYRYLPFLTGNDSALCGSFRNVDSMVDETFFSTQLNPALPAVLV